jgi:hypothetical protein
MKILLKYKTLILFAVILIAFYLVSCRKSIYTTNIERTWLVSTYLKNGADSTSVFNTRYKNYTIIFNNNNGYIEKYTADGKVAITVKGMWQLISNSKTLQLTDSVRVRQYSIDKLKIKSMILKVGSTGQEFDYTPQ